MINEQDRAKMCAESKIGLLATIDETGSPHLTFISSIQPHGTEELIAGQFCSGLSKKFITERSKVGFLIFSPDMEIWRGRAEYERSAESGPEFEMYNKRPLFRYNSYFGIGIVHYFRLINISARENLTMSKIIAGAIKTRLIRPFVRADKKMALNELSRQMFGQIDGLKFISYIDSEGYPSVVPVIQAANAGRDRIVFALNPYRKELMKIPDSAKVAVLFVNLKMESVLVKGLFRCSEGVLPHGLVEIDRVYNSMPPQPQYIYPRQVQHKKITAY